MLKTQKILDAVNTISINDFEDVLNELVERWKSCCTTHEDLVSGLKRYLSLFDEDVLRIYNDAYKVSKRWYDSCYRDYNEIKDDSHHTQVEIDDAWTEVDDAKRDLDQLRKLPRSVTKMTEGDYNWLVDQLSYFDNDFSTKTLEEVNKDDALNSSLDENLLNAFLKLNNNDRQIVLNKEY
ncbi:hypothetical protein LMB33_05590 [Limosilactobacillus reuteri]|uniref:hypothetical protein n=1 Tax=Limosilactobacillus reuteri TaxID=1598 RepID=UPI001E56BEC2|nr:hypothetical protein [Limosilactobacillus reuteri]MCC4326095.1 hypothetical protein [Limosilactobacillus reuteri]MCC4329845.1 hypothetical protein [Limosilactobacillus reuteri]